MAAKVVRLELKTKTVSFNFVDVDMIRLIVKEQMNKFRKKHPRAHWAKLRGYYHNSWWYIGRTVAVLRFYDIYLPYYLVEKVAVEIRKQYPEFKVYVDGTNLRVYFRGEPRWVG